ncbi:hypothetical protein ACLB2K_038018 [Fragaria x ananassa]
MEAVTHPSKNNVVNITARWKKAVDVRSSKGKSLCQEEVFLVGKVLTARDFNRGFFMGMCTMAWQLNGPLASASFLPLKNKEQLVIREIDEPQSANSPITGKRRKRIGGDSVSPKRSQLSLAIGRHNIDATTLGFLPL